MAPKDDEADAVKISVESTDPKPDDKKGNNTNGKEDKSKGKNKAGTGTGIGEEPTMSEEDQELKERLETCVTTVINTEAEAAVTIPLRLKALDVIVEELRNATSSMTSVPKPLKFLRPYYGALKDLHGRLLNGSDADTDTVAGTDANAETDTDSVEFKTLRARLADVLSVLAMTLGSDGKSSVGVVVT